MSTNISFLKPIMNDKEKTLELLLCILDNDSAQMKYVRNLLEAYPNILEYIINDEIPDLSKVKLVKNKRYEYIKNKVLDNLLILKLNGLLDNAFNTNILKLLLKHYCSVDEFTPMKDYTNYIVKLIKEDPYDTLCKIKNIGFIKADSIILEASKKTKDLWNFDVSSSIYRCVSFICWYLMNNLNGSTYEYSEKILKLMKYKYGLADCEYCFNEALKNVKFKVSGNKVMLYTTYIQELKISNFIETAKQCKNNWNIDVSKYRNIDSFSLTDSQLEVLRLINENQLVLLNGYAGTGKSSSIKALINMLEENNKKYCILAPTAKAAKTISYYTGRLASTIHWRLCNDAPDFDDALDKENEYNNLNLGNEFYNKSYEDLDYDIIIIDESSMLSIQLFSILIKYINLENTKVLMIGDSYQLPSIQSGNLYQDLLDIPNIPKVTLTEIFRYTENGLINVATNIRLGNKYLNKESIQYFGNSYMFTECDNVSNMLNLALNKYMELLKTNDVLDIGILTAKNVGNSGTILINNLVQKIINPIGEYDDFISIMIGNNKIIFKNNDVVMNIKNNYNAKKVSQNSFLDVLEDKENERSINTKEVLANGQIGIIKNINMLDHTMIIDFDGDSYIFEYEDIKNLRLAYCFTIHKAQGSQFKKVIYLTSQEDKFMTNSNLMYVAVTRAQENCYHFGSSNVVNSKIKEQENLKRNTYLSSYYTL